MIRHINNFIKNHPNLKGEIKKFPDNYSRDNELMPYMRIFYIVKFYGGIHQLRCIDATTSLERYISLDGSSRIERVLDKNLLERLYNDIISLVEEKGIIDIHFK